MNGAVVGQPSWLPVLRAQGSTESRPTVHDTDARFWNRGGFP